MAIQVSGVNVIDNERNLNVGVLTATSLNVPPQPITFSPTDGATDVALNSNIVITFNSDVSKGSGNITLRKGSASGTVIETIAVSSGSVSISGGQVTINPSDFPTGNDIYVVVDAGAFTSSALGGETELINTYNFSTGPITVSSFSPSDGATEQNVDVNIVITFSENIAKGSGNITLRQGSALGTVRQTIDVTSGAVSVSGTQATINPPSDLQYEEDTYVVVDQGCFLNAAEDADSRNAEINTYNFTTAANIPPLGYNYEGGWLINVTGASNAWILAPNGTQLSRSWYVRCHATTCAQQVSGCSGWFIPSCSQMYSPAWTCRSYWDATASFFWTDSQHSMGAAWTLRFSRGQNCPCGKQIDQPVRAFRCVSY